jgi:hypothetical protein
MHLESRIAPLVVAEGATIKSHGANPEGVIHLRWSGIDAKVASGGAWALPRMVGQPVRGGTRLPGTTVGCHSEKNVALFQENVHVDGLVFNDFHKGGILVENLAMPGTWKNISFGTGNLARGRDLLTLIGRADIRDSAKTAGGEYLIGEPVVIGSQEFDTTGAWQRFELTARVPAEAAGRRLGVRLANLGRGWSHFSTIALLQDGRNIIENGDFTLPDDDEVRPISAAPGWEFMGERQMSQLRTDGEDGRRYAASHNWPSRFGQTTEAQGKAGETLTLTFEARQGTRPRAEIFYLAE